jgi:hypothetical protein
MTTRSILLVSVVLVLTLSYPRFAHTQQAMVVALSRDHSALIGGIDSGMPTAPGTIGSEILAYVTADGVWTNHPCAQNDIKKCELFAQTYLAKAHTYTVISADGRGLEVTSAPTTLSECYGYATSSKYSNGVLRSSAIATDTPSIFAVGTSATRLSEPQSAAVMRQLTPLIPAKLDSDQKLKMYAIQLEGKSFVVVQRAFDDFASDPKFRTGQNTLKFIFAAGAWDQKHFRIHYWKQNIEDENECILGMIHLKSGRDFLITSINDPEGQTFHVYSLRNGKLVLVYSGGGSSC